MDSNYFHQPAVILQWQAIWCQQTTRFLALQLLTVFQQQCQYVPSRIYLLQKIQEEQNIVMLSQNNAQYIYEK